MDKFAITMRAVMLQNPKDALYWLNNSYEEKIDDLRYTKEAIQSFRNLNEDHKKLKIKYEKLLKKVKDLKEYNKLLRMS
jgi:mevalonate pyrophosphate decarboxylase